MAILAGMAPAASVTAAAPPLAQAADAYQIDLARGAGRLHFYVARSSPEPGSPAATAALIVQHGYGRNAAGSLSAGERAVERAGRTATTLVVAPLFQVARPAASHCGAEHAPPVRAGDALWTCGSWSEGSEAQAGGATSFAAYDALLADLKQRWPHLSTVVIAGFSAGGQFVQRYAGFARPPADLRMRYIVADPGTWLYFDPVRPAPMRSGRSADWKTCTSDQGDGACEFDWTTLDADALGRCPAANRWKFGVGDLPAALGQSGAAARATYAAADIAYLEGALDSGNGPGTYFNLLERNCASELEGTFRLQRGLAYAAYDRRYLAPDKQRFVTVVPGCAHDAGCVLPSAEALPVLFPDGGK